MVNKIKKTYFQNTNNNQSNLIQGLVCAFCFKQHLVNATLKQCSRCKVVHYCSLKCQKADFKNHKSSCKEINLITNTMNEETAILEDTTTNNNNLFETSIGQFWKIPETRKYMKIRIELVITIEDIARQIQTKEIWEKVLYHYLELLRLCSNDNLYIRSHVPFILINLNRYDDAYTFIQYWIQQQQNYNSEEQDGLHSLSLEGDWIYPDSILNCHYDDILNKKINYYDDNNNNNTNYNNNNSEDDNNNNINNIDLCHLVAIFIIKLRIICDFDCRQYEFKNYYLEQQQEQQNLSSSNKNNTNTNTNNNYNKILENMIGIDKYTKRRIKEQRKQLEQLMDIIDTINPTMLPSLLHPTPLFNNHYHQPDEPSSSSSSTSTSTSCNVGSPEEARLILKDAHHIFIRIPGANEVLIKRYNTSTPLYDI